MKLKNKKTGEIRELPDGFFCGDNLKKICEEWEDYEEPKEYWFINSIGKVEKAPADWLCDERDSRKSIGNYFETEEGIEQAVKKLEALTRLRNKGFRFDSYDVADRVGGDAICGQVYFKAGNYDKEEIENDLYLLFGGEE